MLEKVKFQKYRKSLLKVLLIAFSLVATVIVSQSSFFAPTEALEQLCFALILTRVIYSLYIYSLYIPEMFVLLIVLSFFDPIIISFLVTSVLPYYFVS